MDKMKLAVAYLIWVCRIAFWTPIFAVRLAIILGPKTDWMLLKMELKRLLEKHKPAA